jgi:hypothetical protein
MKVAFSVAYFQFLFALTLPLASAGSKLLPIKFETTLCSACGVVSQEILLALEREVKASRRENDIDAQGGFSNLEIKMAEWQMISMLDGVCDHMKVWT